MDEAAIQRVVNFSIHMKNSADLILNYASLVSIDTWTLYEVEEAFSLIFEVEKYTNFHVLPESNREHPAIPHIQILYDILQKVQTLRILTQSDRVLPSEQQINLKCFRSLCDLELNSVPINQLKGLQNVRPYLKHLTVTNVCSQLEDILLKCGADMATGFAWENLETANFSRNTLGNLDSSLRFLSAIKVLDLSYCHLVDAISLFCLPTITHLDLSFNKLTSVPALGENASATLQILNLSNNLMIDLRGIERFSNLEVLDLRENFISVGQTLVHLCDLPQLQYLNLFKNPITCGLNYRDHVLRCLNFAVRSYDKFVLDDQYLTYNERVIIGRPTEPRQVGGSSTQLLKYLMDNVTRFLRRGSTDSTGIMRTSSDISTDRASPSQISTRKDSVKKRKNRVRHVSMDNPNCSFDGACPEDDFLNEEETDPNSGQSVESKLALKLPLLYNFVHHEDYMGQLPGPCQSDQLLDEILNASHLRDPSSPDQATKYPESNFSTSALLSSSNSSISKLNDSYSMELSPLTTDDEEIEPNRELYSVICKWEHKMNDKNAEGESEFVFLSFTKYFYKEKSCLTKRTMVKLPISSLQSMCVLSSASPIKVQLNFNHTDLELSFRRFIFEEEDLKLLRDLIEPIIELNKKNESAAPLPCKDCHLPFYGIKARVSGSKGSKKYCRLCGNKKLTPSSIYYTPIVDNYDPFPNFNSSGKNDTEHGHKREKSVISTDSSESVSVCSSGGASACNLKRTNDVDLASNHSMSSIEVLHENLTADGEERSNGTIYFEPPVSAACNVDFRTPDKETELLKNGTSNHAASNISEQTVMQESSSSGSMSGSVCTTVDRLSSGPSTPLRQLGGGAKEEEESSEVESHIDFANTVAIIKASDEGLYLSASIKSTDTVCHRPLTSLKKAFELHEDDDEYDKKGIVFEDPSNAVPLKNWEKNLMESYTSYSWESWKDETDELSYNSSYLQSFSYEDFTIVDHRLKLYFEITLFTENNENLVGLVKVVASIDNETPFHALLAISNRKIYILKITSEEKESPQEWLDVECFCYLEEVPSVYTVFHKQGVMIKMKEKMALLCLADSQRSNAVLYFILNCLEREGYHPCMDDRSCRSQSEDLRRQIDLLEFDDLDSTVHLFQIVTLLHRNGECTNHFLVVTKSHVLLFEADLTWLSSSSFGSEGESTTDLTVTSGYHMDDVTQIELFSDNHFKLDFYQQDGSETKSPWALHVSSPWVGCNFIQTVRPLWENVMLIDLDVVCYSEELFYIKEALRDTEYASYVK